MFTNVRKRHRKPTKMAMSATSSDPNYCRLTHRAFTGFRDPLFRKAEGNNVPAMVVELEDKEAAIALSVMRRVFGISDRSHDGQMLKMIARLLDFVTRLRSGDPQKS
jgi:hypothetical protein